MADGILGQVHGELLAASREKLRSDTRQIARCVALLGDEAWARANGHCNSVGNLVLHLAGNVRQWILSGVGGEALVRDRAGEFAARGPAEMGPLMRGLEETVERAIGVIERQTPESLGEPRKIQDYQVSVFEAILHVVEHFSFHTGQIVHMTKTLRDLDLSRYDVRGFKDGQAGGKPW